MRSRRRALQSFNPLFPRGSYFGENQMIGPVNHIDLHRPWTYTHWKRVTLTPSWDLFWREVASVLGLGRVFTTNMTGNVV